MISMTQDTRLDGLAIPGREQLLQEAFGLVPPELFGEAAQPRTVGELAAFVKAPLAAIVRRLEELIGMTADVEISASDLRAALLETSPPMLLDVREREVFAQGHHPQAILLAAEDFAALMPRLLAAPLVVTIGGPERRALSAALYLRQLGVRAKFVDGDL